MNEEYKQFETVSDSEVIEVASKLMDEFDEAFAASEKDENDLLEWVEVHHG